jgi:tRNA threonylcarbamoyladenosine biosynthesis protein TsaE
VKGIARALDILEPVTSPTYTIISEYEGRLPLYHMDLYRLSGVDEAELLGAEEYIFGDGVCVIEWSEKIRELFPENIIRVHIMIESTDGTRSIEIEGIEL